MIQLKTKNQHLVNTINNGVPYRKKSFTLYGIEVCGVFPVFHGIKVTLDGTVDSLYRTRKYGLCVLSWNNEIGNQETQADNKG